MNPTETQQLSLQLADSPYAQHAMVIDDDPFITELMVEMLHDINIHDVKVAHNGAEAMELLRVASPPPDLLICDLSMPDIDGIEFLRRVGAEGFSGKVVLASGMDHSILKAAESLSKSYGLHLIGALQKPVSALALETLLKDSLPMALVAAHRGSASALLTPAEIGELLANGGLRMYYQPKVAISDMRLVGAEGLCRLHHPQRGLIAPYLFISVIEESGMIDDFTLHVLRAVARQSSLWRAEGLDLKLAVNVSMHNLNRIELPELFASILAAEGVSPTAITLEVTETQITHDFMVSLDVLTRLRIKGFPLSVDDFGTGYSTMENLKRLPFTELKIDRAFVNGAAEDVAAGAIFSSSVKLGRLFNLNLVAEGVETQADWDFVKAGLCDEVQGYFVARPMPPDDFMVWHLARAKKLAETL